MSVKIDRNLKNGELKTIILKKHTYEQTVTDGSDDDVASATVTPEEYYTYNVKDIPEIPFIASFPDYGKFVINGYNEETKAYSGVGSDSDGSLVQCLLTGGVAQYGPATADSTGYLDDVINKYVIQESNYRLKLNKIGDTAQTYYYYYPQKCVEASDGIIKKYDSWSDKPIYLSVDFNKVQGKITANSPLTLSSDNKLSIDQSALQSNLTFASPLKESNGTVTIDLPSTTIPDIPTTDGTYTLKVTVASGVSTFSWIKDE